MLGSKPYPAPLVIAPQKSDQHTHTIILLHGRGSNGERFGQVFLESTDIARRLPTVKFVFLTARKRRSTVLKRIPINQWFDNYSLEDPNTRTDLQVDGLEESSRFLRGLIDEETRLLNDDYSRVIIGGLSQGCATSVFCLLGGFPEDGETKQLGGFIGMSGWLPFQREILRLLGSGEDESVTEDDDPFSHDDSDGENVPGHIQTINHIRDILGLPSLQQPSLSNLHAPVFLGHGAADPKVSVDLGRHMASTLSEAFGMDVTWKVYEEFGHWYKVPDEIDDVVCFLKEKVGVPCVDVL
ncbi:Alpha/Beta hydrolase protein [Aspergillus pseudonomiae]|uniref:Alpha/Beta hydrolase protein n=1 Tax=Aspergillus pseudonomiae TaxID=1506151 RepID=A0A5N6I659_9EURO|nr:Alpha/Beta hydrolase protein [Aspergillus pseudonomiae]KAB8262152.1 Alpha/Beta hydrolase protein [Aspergillus pseudonomiae]KAE8397398.1 Alpha/Beta hydrolase protein [Aspergillus pseudonomiae]